MTHPHRRLVALLMRLAPDLASRVRAVNGVRTLPVHIRGAIADVLRNEAAARDFDGDGRLNANGGDPAVLAEALGLDEIRLKIALLRAVRRTRRRGPPSTDACVMFRTQTPPTNRATSHSDSFPRTRARTSWSFSGSAGFTR